MGADLLATQGALGISNHDIDYAEPEYFGPRTLRVK